MPTEFLNKDKALALAGQFFPKDSPNKLELRLGQTFKSYDIEKKVQGYRGKLVWPFAKTIAPFSQLLVLGMGGSTVRVDMSAKTISTIEDSEPRDFVKQGGLASNYVNCLTNQNPEKDACYIEYIGRSYKILGIGDTYHMFFGDEFVNKALTDRFGDQEVSQPIFVHFDSENMLIPPKSLGVLDKVKSICEVLQVRCIANYGLLINFTVEDQRTSSVQLALNLKHALKEVQETDWNYYDVRLLLNQNNFYETTTDRRTRMFAFKLLKK
jgi:hypothetical protein